MLHTRQVRFRFRHRRFDDYLMPMLHRVEVIDDGEFLIARAKIYAAERHQRIERQRLGFGEICANICDGSGGDANTRVAGKFRVKTEHCIAELLG